MAKDKEKEKPAAAGDQPDAAAAAAGSAKSDRRRVIMIVGGVMLLEGAAIFGAMKLMGGGASDGEAAELKAASMPAEQRFEVEVAKIRAPNVKEGKLVLWSLEVAIRVTAPDTAHAADGAEAEAAGAPSHAESVSKLIKEKERTIKDRLASIVRSAEPLQLQEDGLATLRRQVKFELERTLGPDVHIVEVLIPECTPYPTGY